MSPSSASPGLRIGWPRHAPKLPCHRHFEGQEAARANGAVSKGQPPYAQRNNCATCAHSVRPFGRPQCASSGLCRTVQRMGQIRLFATVRLRSGTAGGCQLRSSYPHALLQRALGENALERSPVHIELPRCLGDVVSADFENALDVLPPDTFGRHRHRPLVAHVTRSSSAGFSHEAVSCGVQRQPSGAVGAVRGGGRPDRNDGSGPQPAATA